MVVYADFYSNLARRQIHKAATGVLGSEDPKERMLSGDTVETTGHYGEMQKTQDEQPETKNAPTDPAGARTQGLWSHPHLVLTGISVF